MKRFLLQLLTLCILSSGVALAQTNATMASHATVVKNGSDMGVTAMRHQLGGNTTLPATTKKKVGRDLTGEEYQAKGDDLTRRASDLSKAKQREEAIRLLDEACDQYQHAANMFYKTGNKGKEVSVLDALAKALRQKIFNLYELSFTESTYKNTWESQSAIYRRTFTAFPIFIQKLNFGLATLAINHEAYDQALPLLESVRTKGSQNPESETLKTKSMGEMALCHHYLGNADKARRIIKDAILRAPSDNRLRQIQRQIGAPGI